VERSRDQVPAVVAIASAAAARNRPGRVLGRERRRRAIANEDVNLETNQLSRQGGEPREVPLGRSRLDDDVLALDITEVTKPLAEGVQAVGVRGEFPDRYGWARLDEPA
jgi:hypothetical protein